MDSWQRMSPFREDTPDSLSFVVLTLKSRERPYWRRIDKWGLNKNVKGNDMLAMAQTQLKRKVEDGKESSFYIRDSEVRANKIVRYLKKKHEDPVLLAECDTVTGKLRR